MADTLCIVVAHDEEFKYRILYEAYDTALSGHPVVRIHMSQETILLVAQDLQMGEPIWAYVSTLSTG